MLDPVAVPWGVAVDLSILRAVPYVVARGGVVGGV